MFINLRKYKCVLINRFETVERCHEELDNVKTEMIYIEFITIPNVFPFFLLCERS